MKIFDFVLLSSVLISVAVPIETGGYKNAKFGMNKEEVEKALQIELKPAENDEVLFAGQMIANYFYDIYEVPGSDWQGIFLHDKDFLPDIKSIDIFYKIEKDNAYGDEVIFYNKKFYCYLLNLDSDIADYKNELQAKYGKGELDRREVVCENGNIGKFVVYKWNSPGKKIFLIHYDKDLGDSYVAHVNCIVYFAADIFSEFKKIILNKLNEYKKSQEQIKNNNLKKLD